ncbi:MAG: O-antigen ligase family protein [Hyphomicrobiales bacterium]|nr:O-antigen ligase family protein [Hyphomicrobiales bacterium]MBV8663635.1 O-antigen ligase family protein [Hyphomicrobiales bacterium]
MSASTLRVPTDEADSAPWGAIAFVAALAVAWITVQPFPDLSAADALDLDSGRAALTYFAFALCAAVCLYLAISTDSRVLQRLANPAYISLAGWVALSSLTSQDVATSLKHAAICAFVVIVAATLPLLPRGRVHLANLLACSAGALLALSYYGVFFMPYYAVHQASDLVEPALAGDWRGVFSHKNDASAMFVLTAFIGIYVARAAHRTIGVVITGLSLLFVVFSNGKTANMLWLPTLAISMFVGGGGGGLLWRAAALAPFVALHALGVGGVMFAPLGSFVASLPLDATFTGRTEIWGYALGMLGGHPFLGYGFDAFWNTSLVRFGTDGETAWVGGAAHGHNCFIDVAMSMGVPGVALALWAFVVQPFVDIGRAARLGADKALLTLLTQIWLFGLYISPLESFLFDRSDPIWFTFLFATFGLRYISSFRTSP